MKNLSFTFIFSLMISMAAFTQNKISVPANSTVSVKFPTEERHLVKIISKSKSQTNVQVVNKATKEQVSAFGLNGGKKEELIVNEGNELQLVNTTDKTQKLVWQASVQEYRAPDAQLSAESIGFQLINKSAKSIPLIIPGVMNPNLSPFSQSGVNLRIGQEIFFKAGGKRRVLLVVDDSIAPGSKLDVGKLIKERRRELGL